MLPLLSLSLSPKRRELRRILELNLSDQSISGQVPLFRARFDDAAFDARTDLYEADVEHAAAEALAVEGLTSTAEAGKNALAPKRAAARIWSINLGELIFAPAELGRLCECFANARCGVTHIFLECNNLSCVPYDPEGLGNDCVRELARAVAARRRADRLDLRGAWKNLIRDLVRTNRAKHDLYLFCDVDTDQNTVVRQAVKNWFNPTGHSVNKVWLARQKGGGGADTDGALMKAVATRHRRTDEKRALPGDRVRVLCDDGAWARGVVALATADGSDATPLRVALDASATTMLPAQLDAATFGVAWRWDDVPECGDVLEYDLTHQPGVAAAGHHVPAHLVARDGLRRCVVVGARYGDTGEWRTCSFVDAGGACRAQHRVLRLPPIDTHGLTRPVWRFQHAAGTTGAAVVAAYVRGRGRGTASAATAPAAVAGLRVVCRINGINRTGVVEHVGATRRRYALEEAAAPPWELAPAPKKARAYKQRGPCDARIGAWIEVYWAGDDDWYLGRIAGQRTVASGGVEFQVAYADGETIYHALQNKPFAGDSTPPAGANGDPEQFRFAAAPPPSPSSPPRAPHVHATPTDPTRLKKGDVIDVLLAGAATATRVRVESSYVVKDDGNWRADNGDAAPPRHARDPTAAPALLPAAAGRRERRKPKKFAADLSSTEYSRALRLAAEKRASAARAAMRHDLLLADGRKIVKCRLARVVCGEDTSGASWTFVRHMSKPAKALKRKQAPAKRLAQAKKPAAETKPAPHAPAAPLPLQTGDRPRRAALRTKRPTDDLSSTELTCLLRKDARTKADTCDVLLDPAHGLKERSVQLRLGPKAFRDGLWQPETSVGAAAGGKAPFVMQTESWEAAAEARKGSAVATRGRLLAKYKGIVFRHIDATHDEVRVVDDIVSSRDNDRWEVSTKLVGGNGDDVPVPYGIGPLIALGMVAAAPTYLQTRDIVLEISKK